MLSFCRPKVKEKSMNRHQSELSCKVLNTPNSADPLTDKEIEQLYSEGVLGNGTPRSLLKTVWLNNCIFFGMRPGKEQRDLCWGDLDLKVC